MMLLSQSGCFRTWKHVQKSKGPCVGIGGKKGKPSLSYCILFIKKEGLEHARHGEWWWRLTGSNTGMWAHCPLAFWGAPIKFEDRERDSQSIGNFKTPTHALTYVRSLSLSTHFCWMRDAMRVSVCGVYTTFNSPSFCARLFIQRTYFYNYPPAI